MVSLHATNGPPSFSDDSFVVCLLVGARVRLSILPNFIGHTNVDERLARTIAERLDQLHERRQGRKANETAAANNFID